MNENINQLNENFETYQEILKNDMDYQNNNITSSNEQIKCYCGHTDYCDCGPLENSKQETPKTFEELFANTGIKPTTDANGIVNYNFKANSKEPKYKLVGECKGNDGNGCFMESCGHNCGCFDKVLIDYSKNKNIEVKYTEDEVRRIAYNAYNYGQLDDPSEGKFNKFFSESKKTL